MSLFATNPCHETIPYSCGSSPSYGPPRATRTPLNNRGRTSIRRDTKTFCAACDVSASLRLLRQEFLFLNCVPGLTPPFERSPVSPDPQSALDKLPNFAGNPELDPAAASALLAEAFHESPQMCADPPTWHEFLQSVKVPKQRSVVGRRV